MRSSQDNTPTQPIEIPKFKRPKAKTPGRGMSITLTTENGQSVTLTPDTLKKQGIFLTPDSIVNMSLSPGFSGANAYSSSSEYDSNSSFSESENEANPSVSIKITPPPSNLLTARNLAAKGKTLAQDTVSQSDIEQGVINEESDLVPAPAQQGWGAWIGGSLYNAASYAATSISNAAGYVMENKIVSATSLGTAMPTALNALVMPSGELPKNIGPTWWDNMSGGLRFHSIANAASALGINTIMNAFFLPTALEKFKNSINKTFNSLKDFSDNTSSIIFGLGAAVAATAIAYSAFLWLPLGSILAGIPALLSFTVALASRYVGVTNVIKRFHNLFSQDANAQVEFADALSHVHEKYLDELQSEFESILLKLEHKKHYEGKPLDINQPLLGEDLEWISRKLTKSLTKLAEAHPDLLKEKATAEYVAKYAGIVFDLIFAIGLVGLPAGGIFMQKGFDGINKIASFCGADFTTLDIWSQRGIGLVSGLASGMLYMDSGSKIRNTLIDLAYHLYENPKEIPFALIALLANGLATSGQQNVAQGVLKDSKNLLGITPGSSSAEILIGLNALGGGVVNTNSSLAKAFLSTNKDAVHINVEDIAKYLSKVNDNLVPHEIAEEFKVFNAKTRHDTDRQDPRTVPAYHFPS